MSKQDFRRIVGGRPPQIPKVAIDRFGKLIEPGHLVMFHPGEDLIFEVVHVGPVLNPSVQGGQAIQAVLRAEFPVQFMPAQPNRGMVIVGESKARIDAQAASNGQGVALPAPGDEEQPPSGIVLTDLEKATEDRETISGGEVEAPERTVESGRPCGCDPGAGWVCEQHRVEE